MALSYATVSGPLLDPAGQPLRNRKVRIYATSANATLRSLGEGAVVAHRSFHRTDSNGNLTVSLIKLPQVGVEPPEAQWRLEYPADLNMAPLVFSLTGDTTWAALTTVAAAEPSETLLEQLSSLVTDIQAGSPLTNRRALAPWYSALANRDNAAAKVMVIGDSTMHYGAASWEQTTVERIRALLQARYPTSGVATPGAGYVPAYKNLAPALPGVQSGGTGYSTGQGLGMEHYNIHNPGTAQYRERAFTGDKVRVWYGKSNYLVHQAIVSIDSVDQAPNLNSNNGSTYPPQVDGDGYYTDYTVTAGAHTVRVRGVSGLAFILDGIEVFNGDQSKGIHVYNAARSGGKAAQYAAATGDRHWEHAGIIQPQLWVIALGINDELDADPTGYLANIDTIIGTKIPAAMGANSYSVLLVNQYRPSRAVDDALWLAMWSGLRDRVGGNVAWLDLAGMWPLLSADGSTSYGLMSEGTNPLHPSTLGHELQAQVIADAIGF